MGTEERVAASCVTPAFGSERFFSDVTREPWERVIFFFYTSVRACVKYSTLNGTVAPHCGFVVNFGNEKTEVCTLFAAV